MHVYDNIIIFSHLYDALFYHFSYIFYLIVYSRGGFRVFFRSPAPLLLEKIYIGIHWSMTGSATVLGGGCLYSILKFLLIKVFTSNKLIGWLLGAKISIILLIIQESLVCVTIWKGLPQKGNGTNDFVSLQTMHILCLNRARSW